MFKNLNLIRKHELHQNYCYSAREICIQQGFKAIKLAKNTKIYVKSLHVAYSANKMKRN